MQFLHPEARHSRTGSCTDCFEEDLGATPPKQAETTPPSVHTMDDVGPYFVEASAVPTPAIHRFGSLINDSLSKWKVGGRYKLVKVLGHGSYGQVAEALDREDGNKRVAIKCISGVFDQQIDTKRILREVCILRHLRHDNVIRLLHIIADTESDFNEIYLVFEFVDTDLYKLINSPQYLSIEHVKTFLYQILKSINYLHANHVIHRDVKPANILLNEDCGLKLCDFGLARVVESYEQEVRSPTPKKRRRSESDDTTTPKKLVRTLTKHVVTRWYRPPELILLQEYSIAVDMWSIGCIFAELLSMDKESVNSYRDRAPLFPGSSCFPLSADNDRTYKDRLDQLNVIFNILGTPAEEDISHLGEVRNYLRNLDDKPRVKFSTIFKAAPEDAIDLLDKMLVFNPTKRLSVKEALKHPFLDSVRLPETESVCSTDMPSLDVSELDASELRVQLLEQIAHFSNKSCANEIDVPSLVTS